MRVSRHFKNQALWRVCPGWVRFPARLFTNTRILKTHVLYTVQTCFGAHCQKRQKVSILSHAVGNFTRFGVFAWTVSTGVYRLVLHPACLIVMGVMVLYMKQTYFNSDVAVCIQCEDMHRSTSGRTSSSYVAFDTFIMQFEKVCFGQLAFLKQLLVWTRAAFLCLQCVQSAVPKSI